MDKDNKKPKKERPFYKVWWYYLIIGTLLSGNIAVLILADETVKTNWLTLISGWVSFIATITIGVIAYNQSKDYKQQNDLFLQEQKDIMWKQNQIDFYVRERQEFLEVYRDLCNVYSKIPKTTIASEETAKYDDFNYLSTLAYSIMLLNGKIVNSFFFDETKTELYKQAGELQKRTTVFFDLWSKEKDKKELKQQENELILNLLGVNQSLNSYLLYFGKFLRELNDDNISFVKIEIQKNQNQNNKWVLENFAKKENEQ